ncbi:MAG: NAD/NADP octopine/nopaline dehydrogenase family protein [Clostridia bacterium]|nr:NAD/NADP octopine/nopaline dehydrogenase family protein [Clostridia bacterium]
MGKIWTVIGGGNGGHATAGQLGLNNQTVRIYDIFEDTVNTINKQGGIHVEGELEGFAPVEFATTDIGKAIEGADMIIVVTPAFAHADIAKKSAPYLKGNQKLLLHPGTMFGSIEFLNILHEHGNDENLLIGEAVSLLYAARLVEKGRVRILGIKNSLPIATIPSDRVTEMTEVLAPIFPQMGRALANVLESGLQNPNCVVHPLPTLLCTSLIESGREWLYYYDGISQSVGHAACALDKERISIGKALGLDIMSIEDFYLDMYNVEADTLAEVTNKVKAYAGVKGHSSVNTRYLLEDIPYSIIPMIGLAKMLGIDVPIMESTVVLSQAVLQKDFSKEARTIEQVGIADMDKEQLLEFVKTGKHYSHASH